jgi:hypothetical protein
MHAVSLFLHLNDSEQSLYCSMSRVLIENLNQCLDIAQICTHFAQMNKKHQTNTRITLIAQVLLKNDTSTRKKRKSDPKSTVLPKHVRSNGLAN